MFSRTISAELNGIEARKVVIEADVSDGLPMFVLVGFLSSAVREAQDRVRTALKNLGVELPPKRITVNLAPAMLRKESTNADLAIAVSVLRALGLVPEDAAEGILFVGEMHLSGELGPVRGILEIVSAAREFGCHTCILPFDNLSEGSVIDGIRVLGARTLEEVYAFLWNEGDLAEKNINIEEMQLSEERRYPADFSQLYGQHVLKRAAEVAVAGFHNLIMIGPPGAGKTMTAKRLPSIMPDPEPEEMLEISRIYSAAGMLPREGFITVRPFRSPHHTITPAGMAGGGRFPVPGEISLAHRGILFLDELPEFRSGTLEILRQPMEDGKIVLSRQNGTYTFPSDFMLVASMNPCKCGYYPDRNRCRCSERDVRQYLSHISQPLLDRMDLCVETSEITFRELSGQEKTESSEVIRSRTQAAIRIQQDRYRGTVFRRNSDLSGDSLRKFCYLGPSEQRLMEQIYDKMRLTGRSYTKILKVARTIADLAGEELIREEHIAEASGYRMIDKKYWNARGGEK